MCYLTNAFVDFWQKLQGHCWLFRYNMHKDHQMAPMADPCAICWWRHSAFPPGYRLIAFNMVKVSIHFCEILQTMDNLQGRRYDNCSSLVCCSLLENVVGRIPPTVLVMLHHGVYKTIWGSISYDVHLSNVKLSGVDRSAQWRQVHIKSPLIHLHTPPNPICSRWYAHEWLKADYKPDSHPPPSMYNYIYNAHAIASMSLVCAFQLYLSNMPIHVVSSVQPKINKGKQMCILVILK